MWLPKMTLGGWAFGSYTEMSGCDRYELKNQMDFESEFHTIVFK
jgi:hypothetical protein